MSPPLRARRALVGLGALCLLAGCAPLFGRQPPSPTSTPRAPLTVTEVRLADPAPVDGAYRVEASIRLDSGSGPALVTFRLRDRASGQLFETTGQLELRPGIVFVAVANVTAPPGDYEPEAVVRFPAR